MSLDFIMSVMNTKAAAAAQQESLEDETRSRRDQQLHFPSQDSVSDVQVMPYSTTCGNDLPTLSGPEIGCEAQNNCVQQWTPVISDIISLTGIKDTVPGNSRPEDVNAAQTHAIENGNIGPAGKKRKSYRCEICHRVFHAHRFLVEHVASHTNDKQYCCHLCHRRFTRVHHLKNHITMKHGLDSLNSPPAICDLCDSQFSDAEKLRIHRLQHTMTRLFLCPTCGKTLTTPFDIQQHARMHKPSPLMHACEICGKRYAQQVTLKMHMLIHENEKRGPCCIHCTENVASRSTLIRHIHRLHPECEIFMCKLCKLKFQLESELEDHLLLHLDGKAFKCQYCDRIFATSYKLSAHIRSHNGEGPYHCPECDKRFRTTSILQRHLSNRHGEKPFKCNLCDKSFHSCARLALHATSHQTERPCVCELCNRTFKAESHLKQHMAAFHSETKPFICQLCHKDFALLSHLNGHTRTQHYEKLECHLCGKRYIFDIHLQAHMKTHNTNAKPKST